MRILSIVGTRPQIIKLCDWEKEILFTGQHFSYEMGESFLETLDSSKILHYLPKDIDHSKIGILVKEIIKRIGEIGRPDCILVHGDTRSALSGAWAAKELNIPLAHSESGVRCYDPELIEERYRIEIDHLADYNFCPIPQAVENLRKEGKIINVYFVGDVLYDKFLRERTSNSYVFVTLHRRNNIENETNLRLFVEKLKEYKWIVFPVHPHTKQYLKKFNIELPFHVDELPPISYSETISYIKKARLVLTDSGGIEREAFWCGTPCKVLREKTEWQDAVGIFGKGNAGELIKEILEKSIIPR